MRGALASSLAESRRSKRSSELGPLHVRSSGGGGGGGAAAAQTAAAARPAAGGGLPLAHGEVRRVGDHGWLRSVLLLKSTMKMAWQPQEDGLRQILTLLKESQSPNTETQRAVHQVSFCHLLRAAERGRPSCRVRRSWAASACLPCPPCASPFSARARLGSGPDGGPRGWARPPLPPPLCICV